MKHALAILLILLAFVKVAMAQFQMTNEVDAIYSESSYNSAQFSAPSYVFPNLETWVQNYNLAYTNNVISRGAAGSSWGGDITNLVEQGWQVHISTWNTFGGIIGMGTDNGGYGSNNQYSVGLTYIQAFTNTFNGTAFTNEFVPYPGHQWYLVPGPLGGVNATTRESAITNLQSLVGQSYMPLASFLITNGLDATNGFTDSNGHLTAAAHLLCELYIGQHCGLPTNIGQLSFDWQGQSATASGWTASGISVSGNTLTATVKPLHFPLSIDVVGVNYLGESKTNDALLAFNWYPAMTNWVKWTIQVTNLPSGNYNVSVDGFVYGTNIASTTLTNGWNMWTNMTGPWGNQREASKDAQLDVYGVNHTNLIAHSAGSSGAHGLRDMVNLGSDSTTPYGAGKRGTNYILTAQIQTDLSGVRQLQATNYFVIQPTNSILTITQISTNLGTMNLQTLTIGTAHAGG